MAKEEIYLVDKTEDPWTTSLKFKEDLITYFGKDYNDKVCLELGSHRGYTTKLLSQYFLKVMAVDNNKEFRDFAKEHWDANNIEYYLMDVYDDEWKFDNCDVVCIDCVNDYEHRKKDIDKCIEYFHNPLLVITDYGLFPGVKKIVDEYVNSGKLIIKKQIGMPKGTKYPHTQNKILLDFEAVICQPAFNMD
jgi:hypothetical protein